MSDELGLKWGTLKSWKCDSDAAKDALKSYFDAGTVSASAMLQRDTNAQTDALCALIDAVDCDKIYLDWDGEYVSKEKAKEYVRGYRA